MNDRLTDEQIAEIGREIGLAKELERTNRKPYVTVFAHDLLAHFAYQSHTELLATRAELAALRERLPRTADGVTILPGMEAFTTMCGLRVTGWVDGLLVDSLGAVTVWIRWVDVRGLERSSQVASEYLYSTAAARDAAEGGA